MNSNMAFEYLIAFLSGRPINADGAAELMLKNSGHKVVGTRSVRFK